jgi:DNA-binding CsgD family transcriptional regulator
MVPREQVFVGREAELAAVSSAIETARSGRPRIVWIEGEPGIGKTAFMRRAASGFEDVILLEASGEESETTLNQGVVLQLLAQAVPGTSWDALHGRIADPSRVSPFSVGAELLAALGSLQDRAPVVVTVDDAQWLDQPSAATLLFVLRRLHGDRVLVLIVSRVAGLDHLGTGWTRLLADAERVSRVPLSGLTAQEVSQLSESLGSGRLSLAASERLREHTRGHPLHVKALLSELSPDRLTSGESVLPAPRSFAVTVVARLSEVSVQAQNLAAAASVAGPHCQLSLAATVAGIDEPLAALEEALAADLLVLLPARIPEEIAFPHPLARAAVHDDLSPRRRRELHLGWARLLSGSAALAHRVAATPGVDDQLAADLRSCAETDIAAGRLSAGVEHLLAASRIASAEDARETALLRAVECLAQVGDTRATEMLDQVRACSDSALRSYTVAVVHAGAARLPEAREACLEVISRPDVARDRELEGIVKALLAIVCGLLRLGDEAVRWAEQALDVESLPPTARTRALQGLGVGLAMLGRGDEGIARLNRFVSSPSAPDPYEAELRTVRGNLKIWWGDPAGAASDLSVAIGWWREGVAFRAVPNAYCAMAEAEYRLGRWDSGVMHADLAVSFGEDNDRAWDLPYIHAVASYLYAARGDWEIASQHVEAARLAAESLPLAYCCFCAAIATAHLAWVRAEWASVLQAIGLLLNPLDRASAGMPPRTLRSMVGEALLFSGHLDQAAAVLDGLEQELATAPDSDPTHVDLHRLRGALAQARRRPEEAEAEFERGRTAAAYATAPLWAGLLELELGAFLRRQGSRRSAIRALTTARDLFTTLEAQPFRDRCEIELSGCGVRSADPGGENRYGLSPRENVVARLVASGKTNREVAGELYLSTKAIEYHLGNVFAKVGVSSRRELGTRLNSGRTGSAQVAGPSTV